jgi:hypothetical protein
MFLAIARQLAARQKKCTPSRRWNQSEKLSSASMTASTASLLRQTWCMLSMLFMVGRRFGPRT